MKKQDTVKMILLAILVLLAYIPTFIWMVGRWTEPDTYYSHGFLVPLISLFIIWFKKGELARIEINPSPWGWVLFISGILVQVLSSLWQISFSSGFSFIPVIAGLVLLFFGKEYLRQLWFPIVFLVFMIPLPLVAVAIISLKLKFFASQISTLLLNLLGLSAIREGSVIKTAHSYMLVEDPCSGIRSLTALVSLSALVAYFMKVSAAKKIAVFISALPIAITFNIIRITVLSIISEIYGAQVITRKLHNTMGILVFVFAFLGLMLVSKLLEKP